MTDTKTTPALVHQLRGVSRVIEERDLAMLMPETDDEGLCPFVDKACETICHGGRLDATSLASLLDYIADVLERESDPNEPTRADTHYDYAEEAESAQRAEAWPQAAALWRRAIELVAADGKLTPQEARTFREQYEAAARRCDARTRNGN